MKKRTLLAVLLVVPVGAVLAWQSGGTIGEPSARITTGGPVTETYTRDGAALGTQSGGYVTTDRPETESYMRGRATLGTQPGDVTTGSTGAQSYKP